MTQINNIDINLYDRQIRTYGLDATKKMTTSSILIIGLEGGLATEIGKHLSLGGIKNIYLFDINNEFLTQGANCISSQDIETGYYFSEETIGLPHSQVLKDKLKELNPYVNIEAVNDWKQNQDVTIIINRPVQFVSTISKYCHKNNLKLVVLYSKGISGIIFVDANKDHLVTDITGENIEPVQISDITSSGIIHCVNNTHNFQNGDFIILNNLEGINLEQFMNKEFIVNVISRTTLQLEIFFDIIPFKFINGTINYVKKPIKINHESFAEQILNPTIGFTFDMDYSKKLINTYLKNYNLSIDNQNILEDDAPSEFAPEIFQFELIPVVSIMGSFAASEAIKLVTNKYLPVNQWFTWYDLSLLPTKDADINNVESVYGLLYGKEFENKLYNSKWLVVGSGAIGCELLKNLAFMNVGKNEGEIIITDPDTIEKSNLNRQFLFRSNHIGESKSSVAASVIKQMNTQINITPLQYKVGFNNLEFLDNIITSGITGVFNALDNIKARRFMDEQCVKYNLPLFESGTTGTKGNTQPVIPFVTECYSALVDTDQDKSYPICTIKSFPNEIHHTIHWALDQFEFFNRAPQTLNKWIENPNYLDKLSPIEQAIAKEDINQYTIKYPTQHDGINGCIRWALDMFTEHYTNSILQLLHTFNPTHEISEGVLFWSSGKRCPTPIIFDHMNEIHMEYIEATVHLLAITSGIDDNITLDQIKELIINYKTDNFIPKDIQIAKIDSELKTIQELNTNDHIIGDPLLFESKYINQEFEKDDDTNWHIKWINSASNLRALNYSIPIIDYYQTKGIAGRIIPAISTTTSIVAGLILLEMIKYLKGYNTIEHYRSTYINLAEPILVYSEPFIAPMIDIAGVKVNSWTKFNYTNNSTLQVFKEYYENMFKTNIAMIVIDNIIIYADFCDSDLLKPITQIIYEKFNTDVSTHRTISNITFTIISDEDDKELPSINIDIK
jgi:ubiquitin-activating enzyme E1